MIKSMIITVVTLLAAWPAIAQQERKFIREGNELFEKQDFEKAEVEYRKAADKKANSFEAAFKDVYKRQGLGMQERPLHFVLRKNEN